MVDACINNGRSILSVQMFYRFTHKHSHMCVHINMHSYSKSVSVKTFVRLIRKMTCIGHFSVLLLIYQSTDSGCTNIKNNENDMVKF